MFKFITEKQMLVRQRRETEYLKAKQRDMETVASTAFVCLAESGTIDEITAAEHPELFAPWGAEIDYTAGAYRTCNGKLYKCLQSHRSQADWAPDQSPSLWTPAGDPFAEYPEWSQPIGAHDAYEKGDKVTHNEKKWVSACDANVWEPGVLGWAASEPSED